MYVKPRLDVIRSEVACWRLVHGHAPSLTLKPAPPWVARAASLWGADLRVKAERECTITGVQLATALIPDREYKSREVAPLRWSSCLEAWGNSGGSAHGLQRGAPEPFNVLASSVDGNTRVRLRSARHPEGSNGPRPDLPSNAALRLGNGFGASHR